MKNGVLFVLDPATTEECNFTAHGRISRIILSKIGPQGLPKGPELSGKPKAGCRMDARRPTSPGEAQEGPKEAQNIKLEINV